MVSKKWLYDLPKIGPYLRKQKYKKAFALNPGEVAIDLGANVGKVTRRMAKHGVMVYAFEPDPRAFSELRLNFEGVENVITINKAVSDHAGKAKIYFHKQYNDDPVKYSSGSSLWAEKGNVDKNNFSECEVVDIAKFLQTLDRPIGLLKIDIEGEEIRVLNRLIDLGLTGNIRNIVVETHERFPFLKIQTENLRRKIRAKGIKNIDLDWA